MTGERKHYFWLAATTALVAAVPLLTDNDFHLRVLFLVGVNYLLTTSLVVP